MKKISMIIISFMYALISIAEPSSSASGSISGVVTDAATTSPIVGVVIAVPALHSGVVTDTEGKYFLKNIPPGIYSLSFSFIGYAAVTRLVSVQYSLVTQDVALSVSALQLPTVSVTATPQTTDILTNTQSVAVIEGRDFEQRRGQTLMQSLENIPGVSLYSTGAAISKPVVRGLSSSRVLVVDDGIRQEGQQWGDEHAPEIDAFDAEKIEVIRGPGSVLYGSDAMGGVVHVVKPEVGGVEQSFLDGTVKLDGFTNNSQAAAAFILNGGGNKFGFRTSFSMRDAGNVRTPTETLFNSGFNEANGSGIIGYHGDDGFFDAGYSRFSTKIQIHENPAEAPEATPYQKILPR